MKRKIKLAFVIGKMNGGGVEAIVMSYLRHLSSDRFMITALVDEDSTLIPQQEIEALGVRLILIPSYTRIFAYHRTLTTLFKKEHFDIVHAHINTLNVFPLFAAWRAGIPVRIAHNHSTAGKGETKKNIFKYMLRPFSKIFPTILCACGQYAGEWIYGKHADFFVMPNSIDFDGDRYRFSSETRDRKRAELAVSDRLVIGHVGRFSSTKNHQFLVEIFADLARKEPEAVLLLIGSGPLEDAVKKQVAERGLTQRVIFAGQREDVAELYQAMDVLVFPSLYEGLGMVPIEAQLSGLPVLSSTAVPKEVIRDEQLIAFLPLSASVSTWADTALKICKQTAPRHSRTNRTFSSNPNQVTAEGLEAWYVEMGEKIVS